MASIGIFNKTNSFDVLNNIATTVTGYDTLGNLVDTLNFNPVSGIATINEAGWYEVIVSVEFASNNTQGYRQVSIVKNGTNEVKSYRRPSTIGYEYKWSDVFLLKFELNDLIILQVKHNAGKSIPVKNVQLTLKFLHI